MGRGLNLVLREAAQIGDVPLTRLALDAQALDKGDVPVDVITLAAPAAHIGFTLLPSDKHA